MGGQLDAVDRGWSSHDQLNGRAVDEDTNSLRARDAAVTALDVLSFHDKLTAEVPRQNVRTRALRRLNPSMLRLTDRCQTSYCGFRFLSIYLSLLAHKTFHYNALQCTMRAGQRSTDNRH